MKIRRVIATVLSAALCFSLILPLASYTSLRSYAEEYDHKLDEEIYNYVYEIWNELVNRVSTPLEGTNEKLKEIDDVKKTVDEVKKNTNVDVTNDEAAKGILKIPEAISAATSTMWEFVIYMITATDPTTSTLIKNDSGDIRISKLMMNPLGSEFDFITVTIRLLAYSIVLVFFSVNIIEESIKYEIFTMKGILRIFGRLLISKLIIDLSMTICKGILGIIGNLILKLIIASGGFNNPSSFMPNVALETSKIKIIGPLIDTAIATLLALVILGIVGTVFVMTFLVIIKLVLRSFELTILVCTSPVFFACASSDVTKEYFRKFIVTFIQVASQTVFMVIALLIGIKQLTGVTFNNITGFTDLANYFGQCLPPFIIMVAMCVMMIKPPKVLTNLLK